MKWALLAVLLLSLQFVAAEHINLNLRSGVGGITVTDVQPLSYYLDNATGGIQSRAWRNGDAISSTNFPCAYSGTLTGGGADDTGWVTITSSSGTATVSKSRDPQKSGPLIGSGIFDPQTATVSWSNTNGEGAEMGLGMDIILRYQSQNGYEWDGSTCQKPTLTDIRASTTSPLPNTNVTIWCESSTPQVIGITASTNISSIVISELDWLSNSLGFTFNVTNRNAINATCHLGADQLSISIIPGSSSIEPVKGLSATSDCVAPSVTLSWQAVTGATQYKIYSGGALNATTTGLTKSIAGLVSGDDYEFEVAAVGSQGQESTRASVAVDRFCQPAVYVPPASFHHAYFARVAGRNVTAYWNDDGAVLVYQNFVYDFSRSLPSSASYELMLGNRQVITMDSGEATSFWRPYTSALRIVAVNGTPASWRISGYQGFDGVYSDKVKFNGYLILYGVFPPQSVVRIGGYTFIPDAQTGTQLNVPLGQLFPNGILLPQPYPVVVEGAGVQTAPVLVTFSIN